MIESVITTLDAAQLGVDDLQRALIYIANRYGIALAPIAAEEAA